MSIESPFVRRILAIVLHHLVGGALTATGIQWSPEVTSSATASTDSDVLNVVLDDKLNAGEVVEIDFGLTCALRGTTATVDVIYKWQARNKGAATWIDLNAAVTVVDIGTADKEYTFSGYRIAGVVDLDKYPVEVRLIFQANEASAGIGKVKNSSYVRAIIR